MSTKDELFKQIQDYITKDKVFIFMKGSPQFPSCGFSAQACSLLNQAGVNYGSFDVLSDEGIRQAIKEFSNWPTIPQIYIDGKFVGGCDILTELYQRGELKKMVGAAS